MASIRDLRPLFSREQQHHHLFYSPVLGRLVVAFEVSNLGVVEQSNSESPHTITSGLLYYGSTTESNLESGLLRHGVLNQSNIYEESEPDEDGNVHVHMEFKPGIKLKDLFASVGRKFEP